MNTWSYRQVQGQTNALACVLAQPRPSRPPCAVGERQQPSAQLEKSSISSAVTAGSLQPLACVCGCLSLLFVVYLRHFTLWLYFLKHISKNVAVETHVRDSLNSAVIQGVAEGAGVV